MSDLKRRWSVFIVLAGCLIPMLRVRGAADVPPQGTTAAQILAKLLPLPDDVSRTIKNPYHAKPAWKLWAIDPSPVAIDRPQFKGTFRPPVAVSRTYPIFAKKDSTKLTLKPLGKSLQAGFWDDCYVSLDSHHTRLGTLKGQFIDGGKMRTARDVHALLQLGANFTSQSYADRGRAIVDDIFNNLNTERHFFFANCIRATPSHASYRDTDEDKVTDSYDGLFGHSYHSLGQSGSEMHALHKMMVAGASMPRRTKNLLKKHGAYAIALLTIFKASLPYEDAQGRPLPYEHELRHRPAYSSNGTPVHLHYCPANVTYHGYDEPRHFQGMIDMASELTLTPPVAVARLLNFTASKHGEGITDKSHLAKRVKSVSLTNMRFWGEKDDVLEARISLNRSYDLQNKALRFRCQALYPSQKNVSIKEETPGVFLIQVTHDPALPKGRIPVICTANNEGPVPSNPVFINFYWPGEKEADDHMAMKELSQNARRQVDALGLKRLPVTVNRRPVVDLNLVGDAVRCVPGQTVSIDLPARDPEGFPVRVFRWSGDIGTVKEGRFSATIPATDRDKVYPVHFIFSDGTGGYTGKQIKLLVGRGKDTLPEGWGVTTLGSAKQAAKVDFVGRTFAFGAQPLDRTASQMQGTFAFQPVSETTDMICRIPEMEADGTDLALMISNTLEGASRHARIGFFKGKILGVIRPGEQSWNEQTYQWDERDSNQPRYFRLTWREGVVAGYVSTDRRSWTQAITGKISFSKQCYAGLFYKGSPWATGICQWLPPSGALPLLVPGTKVPDKKGFFDGPLAVAIAGADSSRVVHYTLDGSEPTPRSPVYQNPITLTHAGRHEIRIKCFQEGRGESTVAAVYRLKSVGG